MKFKGNVTYSIPGVVKILMAAEDVYDDFGHELVVTSLMDGEHKKNSKHYIGNAADLRTFYFSKEEQQKVTEILQDELGSQYDVVLEGDHIHVEYDPK